MPRYQPPYQITPDILNDVVRIVEMVGHWTAHQTLKQAPFLRRENRIKTIQASLAIEQNTLSLQQVTAVLDGKRVLGLPKEIQEVKNAFSAYEQLDMLNPLSLDDLLNTHALMLYGLAEDAGQLRQGGVGVYRGDQLVHMAPPASRVQDLLLDLLGWLRDSSAHPLISSSIVHYELEFIHPFSDGNGRIGRLWQTLILKQWHPLFAYLPVETLIKEKQDLYYQALRDADQHADITPFIRFMLAALADSLAAAISVETAVTSEIGSEIGSEINVANVERAILQALTDKPKLSAKQLAEMLSLSSRSIEKYISRLKQAGKLNRIGSPKAGYWEVL